MRSLLRAVSSVGSEHLVYTQGVRSSSLLPPTTKSLAEMQGFFCYRGIVDMVQKGQLDAQRVDVAL